MVEQANLLLESFDLIAIADLSFLCLVNHLPKLHFLFFTAEIGPSQVLLHLCHSVLKGFEFLVMVTSFPGEGVCLCPALVSSEFHPPNFLFQGLAGLFEVADLGLLVE